YAAARDAADAVRRGSAVPDVVVARWIDAGVSRAEAERRTRHLGGVARSRSGAVPAHTVRRTLASLFTRRHADRVRLRRIGAQRSLRAAVSRTGIEVAGVARRRNRSGMVE